MPQRRFATGLSIFIARQNSLDVSPRSRPLKDGVAKNWIFYCRMVPPSDVCWFINPMNTIVISAINHSYWSYKPT